MASDVDTLRSTVRDIVGIRKDHRNTYENTEEVVNVGKLKTCHRKEHVGDHNGPHAARTGRWVQWGSGGVSRERIPANLANRHPARGRSPARRPTITSYTGLARRYITTREISPARWIRRPCLRSQRGITRRRKFGSGNDLGVGPWDAGGCDGTTWAGRGRPRGRTPAGASLCTSTMVARGRSPARRTRWGNGDMGRGKANAQQPREEPR